MVANKIIKRILGDKYSKQRGKCPGCGVKYVKRGDTWYCPNCNSEK